MLAIGFQIVYQHIEWWWLDGTVIPNRHTHCDQNQIRISIPKTIGSRGEAATGKLSEPINALTFNN